MVLKILHDWSEVWIGRGKPACYDDLNKAVGGLIEVFDFIIIPAKSMKDALLCGVKTRSHGVVSSFTVSIVG